MKQETFFGVRKDSEKHLYVRRGDNNEVLIKAESFVEKITVYRGINPDETPANLAVITIDESDEAKQVREDSGEEPGFSIEGEELEKLISALAKIV